MIQKATWIIPGILVTLLLGLLWAMPAFAAEAGTIQFLGSEGDEDEISFVSLNGDAASGGFWIQVDDSDLDPVVNVSITNDRDLTDVGYDYGVVAAIGTPAQPTTGLFDGESGYTWHDVQDSTNDGIVDNRDFKAIMYSELDVKDGGIKTTLTDVVFTYDRSNGQFSFAPKMNTSPIIHEIQFKVKKQTILGARNGSNQTATFEQDVSSPGTAEMVGNIDLDTGLTVTADEIPTSPDTSNIDSNGLLTWMEFLGSKIPDLGTRAIAVDPEASDDTPNDADDAPVVAVETEVKALINAYNKGDSGKALAVTVNAISGDHVDRVTDAAIADNARQINSIDVVIGNTDAGEDNIDKDTVCVGQHSERYRTSRGY